MLKVRLQADQTLALGILGGEGYPFEVQTVRATTDEPCGCQSTEFYQEYELKGEILRLGHRRCVRCEVVTRALEPARTWQASALRGLLAFDQLRSEEE